MMVAVSQNPDHTSALMLQAWTAASAHTSQKGVLQHPAVGTGLRAPVDKDNKQAYVYMHNTVVQLRMPHLRSKLLLLL